MSEVKLNLIDAQQILNGTIHGSVADSCVAALSAEPETIAELEAALSRYMKPLDDAKHFAWFRSGSEIDSEPWDAGLVIIDLAARIVAAESSYSQPQPEGEVCYHDGTQRTDISIPYQLPSDWLFVNSFEAYRWSCDRHRYQREDNPPFDARSVLYGSPLLEFIVGSVSTLGSIIGAPAETSSLTNDNDPAQQALSQEIINIHANWLMAPRDDLRGQSPREVMLEKQDLIDFDLHTRCLQWTFQGEGPPCLAPDSFAYRFAGFGTHEWIVYYDLVRHLLWSATELRIAPDLWSSPSRGSSPTPGSLAGQPGWGGTVKEGVIRASAESDCDDIEGAVSKLDQIKTEWLETSDEYDGRVPANIIDNERRRLPQAMSAAELIIDENCECCRMLAMDAEMGLGPTFWHLDGCNMDDGFAFSHYLTIEEWEIENRRREEFDREFDRQMEDRRQRIARGEIAEEPSFSEPPF